LIIIKGHPISAHHLLKEFWCDAKERLNNSGINIIQPIFISFVNIVNI